MNEKEIGRIDYLNDDINIYPLTIGQKMILMDCLLNPHSRMYVEQLIVKIHGHIKEQDIINAWNLIFTMHPMLCAIVKWDKIKQPVIITRKKAPQIKTVSLSDKQSYEVDKAIKRYSYWNWNHLVDIDRNNFHITIITGGIDQLFLIIDFHHLFIDGWSLLLILNEFIELIRDKHQQCACYTDQYEKYIRYYLRESVREELVPFWENYLQIKTEVTNRDKLRSAALEVVQKEYCLSQEIIDVWKDKISTWNVTLSAFVYYMWASVLQSLFHLKEIVFGITVSGRNIPVDAVKSIAGMLINTLALTVNSEILVKFNALDAIKSIMTDVNNVNKYALSFYPYMQKQRIQASRLFGSVVTVQNYPGLQQNDGHMTIEYINRRYLNNNSLSFSVRHQYGSIYFDFGYDKNLYTDDFMQNIFDFMIHLIQTC